MDSISEESELKSSEMRNNFYEDLLFESCRLTGNYKNQESNLKSLFKPNRWNPSGTIQVYDHLVNRYIPLEGAEVHAR